MTAHRAVSVGWKAKAIAFNVFDRLPFGERLYYLFQRHITKSLPRPYVPTSSSAKIQILQAQRILARRKDVATLQLLEIGAGWDLYANLVYWCYGLERQIAVDIRRWARAETVNAAIRHLAKDPPPGAVRIPQTPVSPEDFDGSLLALYGIRYLAPLDATRTGLDPASVDVITTTSVFEHIPGGVLAGILGEFRRIIRPDGIMSHTIDFTDHYSHADPAISDYNYLRFGAREWLRYNPGIHYQNRLRAPDYTALLHEAGFEIVQLDEWGGRPSELDRTPVHPDFSKYARDDLLTIGANFLVAPAR
jgi:hypothetical protein